MELYSLSQGGQKHVDAYLEYRFVCKAMGRDPDGPLLSEKEFAKLKKAFEEKRKQTRFTVLQTDITKRGQGVKILHGGDKKKKEPKKQQPVEKGKVLDLFKQGEKRGNDERMIEVEEEETMEETKMDKKMDKRLCSRMLPMADRIDEEEETMPETSKIEKKKLCSRMLPMAMLASEEIEDTMEEQQMVPSQPKKNVQTTAKKVVVAKKSASINKLSTAASSTAKKKKVSSARKPEWNS